LALNYKKQKNVQKKMWKNAVYFKSFGSYPQVVNVTISSI